MLFFLCGSFFFIIFSLMNCSSELLYDNENKTSILNFTSLQNLSLIIHDNSSFFIQMQPSNLFQGEFICQSLEIVFFCPEVCYLTIGDSLLIGKKCDFTFQNIIFKFAETIKKWRSGFIFHFSENSKLQIKVFFFYCFLHFIF